jgi:hypothetical protein
VLELLLKVCPKEDNPKKEDVRVEDALADVKIKLTHFKNIIKMCKNIQNNIIISKCNICLKHLVI